jgi:hypothetical protein
MRAFQLSPALVALAGLALIPALLGACGGGGGNPSGTQRITGQTDFASAPLPGSGAAHSAGGAANAGTAAGGSSSGSSSGGAVPTTGGSTTVARTVQETDIYRVDGNYLYYLNSYRGLMVFDVTNVDQPKLVGRSPIFGDPQEMIVSNGIAVVVVGDWYGTMSDGTPFHGSIARGLDCTDPSNIKDVGDAYLGGYVQDTRVVGNVLYTVAQDYGWEYGWEYGWGGYYYYGGYGVGGGGVATPAGGSSGGGGVSGNPGPTVKVASINFANGVVQKVGEQTFNGYGGIFNVTPVAIMLANQHQPDPNAPYNAPGLTDLQYIDISDPNGGIKLRGSITINGWLNGWGPDNGRWNLDFTDSTYAHAIGCSSEYCGTNDTYLLTTVDFSNPDAPAVASTLPISNLGWSAAARFDVAVTGGYSRMYLSPADGYSSTGQTPFSIYDLSDPKAPKLAGSTTLDGQIWLFIPNQQQLFALGNTYTPSGPYDTSLVEVQYVDVTNAAAPQVLGATQFGNGWAWSPASGTFKAFVINATQGLAVVPFSGWNDTSESYFNGVQLVSFSPTALTSSGTARTKGWVERGIFVKNRLLSLSDQALSVVDYTNAASPQVITEMTLARNVVNAQPQGTTIAELSSDWWGNDTTTSEMRVLPIANAAETTDNGQGVSTTIKGVDAQVFQNGTLAYVVTDVQVPVPCGQPGYGGPQGPNGQCMAGTQQVQVVDTSNGQATLRGTVTLPVMPNYYYYGGWGWEGFWYYDWYNGADVIQVGGDALAFRRWFPQYAYNPQGYPVYEDDLDALYVVDVSNPDAPGVASLTITDDTTAWWGNMTAIGNTLYTTHYEYINHPSPTDPYNTIYTVRYYLDQVDLSDRAHPRIGMSVNVPGTLVGASSTDPTILYFADYRWDSNNERDDIAACKLDGGKCYLQSITDLDGYVGNVIVQNDKAYMTVQEYDWMYTGNGGTQTTPYIELHQLDLTNPQAPVDRVATDPNNGWGWLLGVQGDRAIVTSGWGPVGVDIYHLSDTAAPAFEQSVRTLGWGANSITRQGNTLYLASGYWGVQPIVLQ